MNPDIDVTYRTVNLFSPEKRFIYFISNVTDLLKSAINFLSNSGSGKFVRYMWNGGLLLFWNRISDLFHEDGSIGLHILPKLTYDHTKLTPHLIMNVKLAAQVLSSTVSRMLSQYRLPEASGIARFCILMDEFFDIMNIRDIHSHEFQPKPSLMPFTFIDDPWFSWLRNVFFHYFEDWLASIERRDGSLSKKEKNKILYHSKHMKGWKF